MIKSEKQKSKPLRVVVETLAKMKEFDQALTVIEVIEGEEHKAESLSIIAKALAAAGEQERAIVVTQRELDLVEGIIERIEDFDTETATALKVVTQILAEIGNFDRALALVRTVEDKNVKTANLCAVATVLAQAGRSTWAWQVRFDAFTEARLGGRVVMFKILEQNAEALAVLDQGETLWRVYQAVMEVEGWWGGQRMRAERFTWRMKERDA